MPYLTPQNAYLTPQTPYLTPQKEYLTPQNTKNARYGAMVNDLTPHKQPT